MPRRHSLYESYDIQNGEMDTNIFKDFAVNVFLVTELRVGGIAGQLCELKTMVF